MNNLRLLNDKCPLDMPIGVVDTPSEAPDIELGEASATVFVEGTLMAHKIYVVRNRAYKPILVVAETTDEALQVAAKSGHVKRASAYRKVQSFDDYATFRHEAPTAAPDTDFAEEAFGRALTSGRSGCASLSDRGTWLIDGFDTWPEG